MIHKFWDDPTLPSTKASHYVLGHAWRITDIISSDVQVYSNNQWGVPRMADEEDLRSNPDARWLSDGRGRMRGVELMLHHENNGRFFGWLAYTLARSERWNPHKYRYELYREDETHNIQLLGSYHLSHNWDIGSRIRYTTGKPTTPVITVEESENYNYYAPVSSTTSRYYL